MTDGNRATEELRSARLREVASEQVQRERGRLILWAVLREDRYETIFADGLSRSHHPRDLRETLQPRSLPGSNSPVLASRFGFTPPQS